MTIFGRSSYFCVIDVDIDRTELVFVPIESWSPALSIGEKTSSVRSISTKIWPQQVLPQNTFLQLSCKNLFDFCDGMYFLHCNSVVVKFHGLNALYKVIEM